MMTEQEKPEPVRPVTNQETVIAFSGPAPSVNKFFVHITGLTARIAFAELAVGIDPVFRSAVSMTLPDLMSLTEVLQKTLKDHMDKTGIKFEHVPPKENG